MPEINIFAIALYGLPVAVFVVIHVVRRVRRNAANAKELEAAIKAGLSEPVSLHPVVDPSRCVGSGACVNVCPESALGIIDGKAQLTNPAVCIGHGACAAACPVSAITLVFGSERRGVDIPRVNPNFETNVPGVFIAGELGGMGLIRKAAEQGKQALETIASRKAAMPLDVVIIGAGPAGIAAGLSAIERKLRYRLHRAGARSRRRDPALPPQQDRDDFAGRPADRRSPADRRNQQGGAAANLAGRRRPVRDEDRFRHAHGGH